MEKKSGLLGSLGKSPLSTRRRNWQDYILGMNSKTDNVRTELEFQKLQNEKQYLASMAMQLQEQINFIMANGGAAAGPVNPMDALKLSPKRSSPQATIPPVGPLKTGEDIKDAKTPEFEDLTGMDS